MIGGLFNFGTSTALAPTGTSNPFTPQRLYSVLGPPPNANLFGNKIASTIYAGPYSGPGDLDRQGGETEEMRWMYDRYSGRRSAARSTPLRVSP